MSKKEFIDLKILDNEEICKPIPGYEGVYYATVDGDILKKNNNKVIKLKSYNDHDGYRHIKLRKNNNRKDFKVARLILLVFVGKKPSKKHCTCHNNGIRNDDRLCNLRWDTYKNNEADKKKHGTYLDRGFKGGFKGETNCTSKLTKEDVLNIRKIYKENNITVKKIAKKYNVDISCIYKIVNKETWKHI